MGKYDDIIHLSRPLSKKHPTMPMEDRAAQFSPFAALTGHDAAIEETSRITVEFSEPDEEMKHIINEKLLWLKENSTKKQEVLIIYFEKDSRKEGGSYKEVTGIIEKFDSLKGYVTVDNSIIPVKMIKDIVVL